MSRSRGYEESDEDYEERMQDLDDFVDWLNDWVDELLSFLKVSISDQKSRFGLPRQVSMK